MSALCQIGQQAFLAQTLLSLQVDVCCVSETHVQDPSSVILLRPPEPDPAILHFTMQVSDDPAKNGSWNIWSEDRPQSQS